VNSLRVKSATAEREQERKATFPMRAVKLADPDDEGRRKFRGYAAVFGNRDHHGDIIVKGAFEKSLRERPEVKVLWQHDPSKPIGLGTAYEDDYGLVAEGTLSNTKFVQEEVLPLMTDGVVNGLSIGYRVAVEERNDNLDAWLLKEIDLHEFSPVTFPANELATVSEVKSLDSRADAQVDQFHRNAKSLIHQLSGYFAKDDRADHLDRATVKELHDALGGLLPDAITADVIERAFYEGGLAAIHELTKLKNQKE